MTSLNIEKNQNKLTHANSLPYRSDIDGLRAVAVLSVLIFHAFPTILPGGFIGVDIFFVISGYLISSILIKDLSENKFSVLSFYQRRIIRIFPALIIVIISCLVFGWLALLPDEYKSLSKHAIAGAGFVSNLVQWSEASYFDVGAEAKPLLHLWSLGVEEQFYLIWPILLLAAWRKSSRLYACIFTFIAVSFALNIYQSRYNPSADFYSPLTRFWELLIGALIAANPKKIKSPSNAYNYLSVLGLALIITALTTITKKDAFPGFWALLPVIGSGILISSGKDSIVNRIILSNKTMVAIGLISYPLYLWHWPLLSFASIVESSTPSSAYRIIALIASFILAIATYKFIEAPFRKRSSSKRQSTIILSVAMIILVAFSIAIYLLDGIPERSGANPVIRYPAELGRDPYLTYISENFSRCKDERLLHLSVLDTGYGYRCFQSKADRPIEILLLGDSHAEHWLPGLADNLSIANVGSLIQPDLPTINSKLFADIIPVIADNKDIKTVILSAMWLDKINQATIDPDKQIKDTINILANGGKTVYLFDDIPTYEFTPEKCMYGRRFSTEKEKCEISKSHYLKQKKLYYDALTSAVENNSAVQFLPVSNYLCDDMKCSMIIDNVLVYRDTNHLNIKGSKLIMSKLKDSGFTIKY